jgi:uroporphyrinogen decarboxylase
MNLTSQERVNRALEHKDHDRVPRHDNFWVETIARWQGEGLQGSGYDAGVAEAESLLGSDFCGLSPDGIYWPFPYPGRREVTAEDEGTVTFVDEWGAKLRQFKVRSGTPEHLGWECDSPEVWYERLRPRIAEQAIRIPVDAIRERHALARKEGKWCSLHGIEPFELTRKILGDVEALAGMVDEPEWIADISRVTTDNSLRNWQAVIDAGIRPDGIWVYGDMAYNHAPVCSPKTYREIIWPDHKRMCDWAHANGLKFIYHTDGDVNLMLDLYLEAGFDCLQPLEAKANMDVRELVEGYGERLSMFGNIDVMAMITNDMDRIEEEIRSKFAATMPYRGYLYHSDHSVPPQVSWATYQGIIGLVERYGRYD